MAGEEELGRDHTPARDCAGGKDAMVVDAPRRAIVDHVRQSLAELGVGELQVGRSIFGGACQPVAHASGWAGLDRSEIGGRVNDVSRKRSDALSIRRLDRIPGKHSEPVHLDRRAAGAGREASRRH